MSDIRFVLTKYKSGILTYSIDMQNARLETVHFYNLDDSSENINIGDIFVAKVMNVVGSINAAFVDYQKGKHGYLPTSDRFAPVLLNREYDGRLKAGDELLVQLEKEAVRSKEPVFTSNLSLAGKYCVITTGNNSKGVSKKCPKSIRNKLLEHVPEDIKYGIVVRTNASELVSEASDSLELLEKECLQLSAQMDVLVSDAVHRTCYSRVWQSPPPYLTALRDARNICYSQIITDDEGLYNELSAFLKYSLPEMLDRLTYYTDTSYSLTKLHSIETRLGELLSSKVWLKSGAYLVIEKTEAMYVIDVNSGKNIAKKSNAEYIRAINLEAAREVMYHLRLRNLTGIIIVDFINMDNAYDKEMLLHELKQAAKRDPVRTVVVDMTALDLVEITRQKNTKNLAEQLSEVSKKN